MVVSKLTPYFGIIGSGADGLSFAARGSTIRPERYSSATLITTIYRRL